MGKAVKIIKKPASIKVVVKDDQNKDAHQTDTQKNNKQKNDKKHTVNDKELSTAQKIKALNDKITDFRNGKITEETFDKDDKRRLWDRLTKARNSSTDPLFHKAWNDIQPTGQGSDARKNIFLFAWLKDPEWGKTFLTRTSKLLESRTMNTKNFV